MEFRSLKNAIDLFNLANGKHEIRGNGEKMAPIESSIITRGNDTYIHVENVPKESLKKLNAAVYVENGKKEKEAEKENEDGNRRKPKLLPLIIIPAIAIFGLGSCSHIDQIPKDIITNKQVVLYATDSPATVLEGLAGIVGQEEMTNRYVVGNGEYDWKKQSEREQNAVESNEQYNENRNEIDECLNILANPDLSQEEKVNIIKKLNEVCGQEKTIFETHESSADELASEVVEALKMNPDERTEGEIKVVEGMQETYDQNLNLSGKNVETVGEMEEAINSGKKIEGVEINEEADGDVRITYQEVYQVVEQQSHKGISAAVHNVKDFFDQVIKKISNKVNNKAKDVQNISDTKDQGR